MIIPLHNIFIKVLLEKMASEVIQTSILADKVSLMTSSSPFMIYILRDPCPQAITSAGWYLGVQVPDPAHIHGLFFDTWQDFYNNEPILPSMNAAQSALVMGGEACQWGEQVSSETIDAISWPRTAAVAERLWSERSVTDIASMKMRLNQLQCLLVQRGVHASPISPGYCPIPK